MPRSSGAGDGDDDRPVPDLLGLSQRMFGTPEHGLRVLAFGELGDAGAERHSLDAGRRLERSMQSAQERFCIVGRRRGKHERELARAEAMHGTRRHALVEARCDLG